MLEAHGGVKRERGEGKWSMNYVFLFSRLVEEKMWVKKNGSA